MIKLACNYLSELEELVLEQAVEIDYFKYPSVANDPGFDSIEKFYNRIENAKKVKPILYHGHYPHNTNICSRSFINDFDVDLMNELCKRTSAEGISLHFNGAGMDDTREEVIKNTCANIEYLKKHFNHMEFLSFENIMGNCNQHTLDPEVIAEVIRETKVDFLYDVSHAYWCSRKRNESFENYVSKLPLERVYEVHVNGWDEKNGDIQSHMIIQEELYTHIEEIVCNYPVKILTLEYGRHNDRIGVGCPVVYLDSINEKAKEEVKKQLLRLHNIITNRQSSK